MKSPVSRSKMSKKIHSEKDSERVIRDGTAARTRPLSIQDIMLRREKKAASEDKKTKEGPQENDKGLSDYMEQGRRSKGRKEPKGIPVEGSKKEKNRETTREGSKKENPRHEPRENPKMDDVRYTPKEVSRKGNFKDRPKDGPKINDMKGMPNVEKEDLEDTAKFSRKERSYIRDDDHIVVRDKGISTSHKLNTRDDESRDANLGDMRAKNGDTTKSRKGPGKSWNDETVPSSRINDRSEKRNETKRKDRSFDDEKKPEVDRPVLKRHDSARSRDSKHPDKNDGRTDYAKSYHGEPKLKRRRSRSRDLDQEKHGRSISPPPREQRRSHRDDSGNYPPYYSVDKARKHSETDKQRTSGNGAYTGGSYRRHESRLGGYSPRRKKTAPQAEAATTKTSSPVTQSPKKKPATWDQRPAKTDRSNFLATLHPAIGQMAPILANVSALKKDPTTKAETILTGSNLSVDSVQLTQATRPLRRLHIENLPDSTTEDILIDCLNDILLSSHPKHAHRSKPCLSCTINKEKRQAFVEFLTPEDATTALSFDGRSLKGSALKIRRPKEYVEMVNEAPTKAAEEVTLVSDRVADSPHKIFVAGISGVISSEMLMEIVSAFGPLAAYRFLFNEELGGPCAFLEYTDPSITPKACAGLSGMKLGGRVLTAVHVFTSPAEFQVDNEAPFYGIPDNAKSLLEEPTKVLQLKDVFDQEEYMLLSKSELEETLEDIRIECARFGAVKSVNLVKRLSGSDNTAEGNVLQPEDKSIKIEPTELHHHDSSTEAASEYSVPNQSVDVPYDSDSAGKDVDPTPEGLGQKDLPSNDAALCDGHEPGADLDDIQERSAPPTLQQVKVDDKVPEASTNEDKHMEAAEATALVDDDAVEKGLESIGSETCRSAAFGDEALKSGRENKQLGADEDHKVKAPAVQMAVGALVFEPGSVLVEFTREEAACMAAHSLHGRRFGNRTVSVRYAPHDLYLQKYPR